MELSLPSHFGNGLWNSSLTWWSLDWLQDQEATGKLIILQQSLVSFLERLWYHHFIWWPAQSFEGTWKHLDWLKLFGWHSIIVRIMWIMSDHLHSGWNIYKNLDKCTWTGLNAEEDGRKLKNIFIDLILKTIVVLVFIWSLVYLNGNLTSYSHY